MRRLWGAVIEHPKTIRWEPIEESDVLAVQQVCLENGSEARVCLQAPGMDEPITCAFLTPQAPIRRLGLEVPGGTEFSIKTTGVTPAKVSLLGRVDNEDNCDDDSYSGDGSALYGEPVPRLVWDFADSLYGNSTLAPNTDRTMEEIIDSDAENREPECGGKVKATKNKFPVELEFPSKIHSEKSKSRNGVEKISSISENIITVDHPNSKKRMNVDDGSKRHAKSLTHKDKFGSEEIIVSRKASKKAPAFAVEKKKVAASPVEKKKVAASLLASEKKVAGEETKVAASLTASEKKAVESDLLPLDNRPRLNLKKSFSTGLKYEITAVGEGSQMARKGSKVTVEYAAILESTDKKFDDGKLTFVVGAGQVVAGFERGVEGMFVKEERTIRVPAHLGYGKEGIPGLLPPNANLKFNVRLTRVASL